MALNLLGIQVTCADKATLLDRVITWARQEERRTITYINAHCVNTACADVEYRELLNRADLVYSDGIGVVWASRFLAGSQLEKITGRDWIDEFCAQAQANSLRLYVLAGSPGIAQAACRKLKKRFAGLEIAGASDGYFQEKSEQEVLEEITRLKPQVVFIGLGVPLQEKWLAEHRQGIPAQVCWAVGALFDYLAGVEAPVPGWMDRLALEWLWRLMADPKHKWRRYLLGNPEFVFRVVWEKIRGQGNPVLGI